MGIALCEIDIACDAPLWPLHFVNFSSWVSANHVACAPADTRLQCDQTDLLQQQQASALVHRIVSNAAATPTGMSLIALCLREYRPMLEKAGARAGQLEAVLLNGVVQERLVLEKLSPDSLSPLRRWGSSSR